MKRIKVFLAAFVLSISSMLGLVVPHAFAATKTWDGGGGDNNMMTGANWAGDAAPSAGDDLVFPANISKLTVTNDFTAATSFNSITFSGAATQDSGYTISGNSITLVAGITNSMTSGGSFDTSAAIDLDIILGGNQTFQTTTDKVIDIGGDINLGTRNLTTNTGSAEWVFSGVISGTSGTITKGTGAGALILTGDNTFDGAITLNNGNLVAKSDTALGSATGGTTVASGAALIIVKTSGDQTVSEPLNLSGTGISSTGALELLTNFGIGGLATPPYGTTTLSGSMTLGADTSVDVSQRTGKLTGALSGAHALTLADGSVGTFVIAASSNSSSTANATLEPAAKTTSYADDQTGVPVTINYNETVTLNGMRGDVVVNPKGVLKGTGTAENVTVAGTIAPGLSPGCLNTGDLTFVTGSTYQFEVGGTTACTEYDQIKVTGAVTLAGTLDASLYNNFKPTVGQKYVIVSNDASDAVTGTFSGLAQGATFKVSGYTLSISYTGGDGNDVELTVTALAPNTGFALLANNPAITFGATLGAAIVIACMARRQFMPTPSRRRR